jgi:hypothetical protein
VGGFYAGGRQGVKERGYAKRMLKVLRRWTMEVTAAFAAASFLCFVAVYGLCTSSRPRIPLPELNLIYPFNGKYRVCYVSFFEHLILNRLWLPGLLVLLVYGMLRLTFKEQRIGFDYRKGRVAKESLHGEGDMDRLRLAAWFILFFSTYFVLWWATTPAAFR